MLVPTPIPLALAHGSCDIRLGHIIKSDLIMAATCLSKTTTLVIAPSLKITTVSKVGITTLVLTTVGLISLTIANWHRPNIFKGY